jgi:hypothetical protein
MKRRDRRLARRCNGRGTLMAGFGPPLPTSAVHEVVR